MCPCFHDYHTKQHNFQQGSNSFITVSLELCSMSNSLDVAAHGILFLNILP